MSPYRDPPAVALEGDPLELVPGQGLRGIWVGRARADDVQRVFGPGECAVHSTGDVFQITYPSGGDAPHQFMFEFGLVDAIVVAATQGQLFVAGGLRIRTPRAQVLRRLGPPDELLTYQTIDTLRYLDLGLEVGVSNADDFGVLGFTIFRARR